MTEAASSARRFAFGLAWTLFGTVLQRGANVAAAVLIARFVGREQFGAFGIFQSTIGIFQVFVAYGMGLTATRYVAQYRRSDPVRAGQLLAVSAAASAALSVLAAVLVFATSDLMAQHLFRQPELAPLLRVGSIALLFGAYNGAQLGALTGLEAFSSVARVNTVNGLTFLIGTAVGARFYGAYGAVCGAALSNALTCLTAYPILQRVIRQSGIRVTLRGSASEWRHLYLFSLPAIITSTLVSPVSWAGTAMLVRWGGGLGQVGLYNAANQWRNVMLFLPSLMTQVSLPLLASQVGREEEGGPTFLKTLQVTQTATDLIALSAGSVLMFAAPIALAVYGRSFWGQPSILVVLVLACMYQCSISAMQPALEAKGKMWLGARLNLLWAVVNLSVAWLTVSRFGALGLAASTAAAYLCLAVVSMRLLRQDMPGTYAMDFLLNTLYSTALAVFCLAVPGRLRYAAGIPLFGLLGFLILRHLLGRVQDDIRLPKSLTGLLRTRGSPG